MSKILLVEDSKSYSNIFKVLLENKNFEVDQAFTLKKAKDKLLTNSYEYILLDLILPDGEGLELLETLSEYTNNKGTKFIVLSGEHDIQKRNYLFEHGIIEYFSKSVPIKELCNQVLRLISDLKSNKNKNILIVDDSKFVIKSMTDVLTTKNYNVISFYNAIDALVYLENNSNSIDLIFSDVEMPEMDGIEFLLTVKKKPDCSNIPIIILSSVVDREIYAKALRNGAVDFLRKPFLVEEILLKANLHIKQSDSNKKIQNQAKELVEYKKALNDSDIISKTDPKGIITFVNDKFCEISGYTKDELVGKSHNIVRHPDMPKSLFKELWETVNTKKTFKGIIKNKKKNGEEYYVDATISPILDVDGNIKEIIGIRHDVTDIMNPKKQLLDDMNNIENPLLIISKIANYKIIREFYTKEVRDRFAESFSNKLLSYFPDHLGIKKVYTIGEGLFAFLKGEKIKSSHIKLSLTKILNDMKKDDFEFEGNKYQIDLLFSFADQGESLFDDVSIGLNKLKNNKNNIIYANNFYKMTQIDARQKLRTLTLIKNSLREKDRVVSYYQPIVSNKTKEIIKYESLIRIVTKNQVLSPFSFMDIAKMSGYYYDLTKKVIENAEKILNRNKELNISINLSSSDMEDIHIKNKLLSLISEEDNKGRITFELLEDEDIKDIASIQKFIQFCKIIGEVKISIDDFGSGYSNYERLSLFQPDIIKIDGSLIKDITLNKYNESVVKSIVLFAKENSIKTVAEFVSSEEIHEKVKSLGIDYSQGYLFGKPEPFDLSNLHHPKKIYIDTI